MEGKKIKKGILLPPAVGYSMKIVAGLVRANKVKPAYYPPLLAISLINLVNLPFRAWERNRINPGFKKAAIEKDPVFIIGHWRSGTTHLHNILCQDPRMAYVTTYQSVFPDTLVNKTGRFIFENFMKWLIPAKRKGDNVDMGPSFPQEEEFTLGARTPVCYYYFWIFPQNILKYYESFVRFRNINPEDYNAWKEDYKLIIKKALMNTGGTVFLSKNPSNTGRVKILLELFPNAKFIHIHRNPVEVFLSTLHFYSEMLKPLQLQDISEKEIENAVFEIYVKLMSDYLEQRQFIPQGNLIEISFDELENTPGCAIEKIYNQLKFADFDTARPYIDAYVEKMKSYRKNVHTIRQEHLDKILNDWGFVFREYNYSIPDNIRISDEK